MSKPQLFCYPFAGGTANFFDELEKDLPRYDVVKFEYAGHGNRYKEPFYQSFNNLADDAYESLCAALTGIPYALFGYSMGSITLMEVLKRILDSQIQKPKHLFLAAHEPEPRKMIRGLSGEELDEWVKTRVIRYGAVPENLVNNKTFWRTYFPIYMADYRIIGEHRFEELTIRTDIPATVFYSETDTPLDTMKQWRRFFVGDCAFQRYYGQHFFLRDHHVELAERIMADMSL